jgi:hypothetical protein
MGSTCGTLGALQIIELRCACNLTQLLEPYACDDRGRAAAAVEPLLLFALMRIEVEQSKAVQYSLEHVIVTSDKQAIATCRDTFGSFKAPSAKSNSKRCNVNQDIKERCTQ